MVHRKLADEGEGLQIWRVAVNILNKQLQTADKGCPPAWRLGRGLTTPHRKKETRYEMLQRALELDRCFGTT
jgi:hypothetical protein